jgi:hypothetical protein
MAALINDSATVDVTIGTESSELNQLRPPTHQFPLDGSPDEGDTHAVKLQSLMKHPSNLIVRFQFYANRRASVSMTISHH